MVEIRTAAAVQGHGLQLAAPQPWQQHHPPPTRPCQEKGRGRVQKCTSHRPPTPVPRRGHGGNSLS